MEFDVLGIPKRPFTAEDTISVAGYMAYSFAAAFRTEPLLTYVRDQLGADYLNIFDLDWQPKGVLAKRHNGTALSLASDWKDLNALARLSEQALADNGLPQFEGSNAWAVAGSRTKAANRCWPVTRISAFPCHRCGTKRNSRRRVSNSTATIRRWCPSPRWAQP
jgi:penicillin amidase